MSSDKSCIIHVPESLFVAIRQDYVGICTVREMRHPHCAAALLNMFERWHNVKLSEFDQELAKHRAAKANKQRYKVNVCMWVYMSKPAMREEMQGLFGETVISHSIQDLEKAGFIKSRNNPGKAWDRTLQYLFFPMRVQNALFKWANSTDAPSRISTASKSYKYGMQSVELRTRSRKSKAAIPQSHPQKHSQTPTQIDDESSLRIVKPDETMTPVVRVARAWEQVKVGTLTRADSDGIKDDLETEGEALILKAIELVKDRKGKPTSWNYLRKVFPDAKEALEGPPKVAPKGSPAPEPQYTIRPEDVVIPEMWQTKKPQAAGE